ncbi:MAG: malto-oligosyltrehalose synthase [Bacteroidia bacterium]
MHKPAATYRIQFNKDFTFRQLRKQLPYLQKLGISTIYASPVFQARPGSTHGYDVVNPLCVNEEIGTLDEWREIKQEMKEREMGWLQDIVPNHMAFHCSNPWLHDIFELGPESRYYHSFDIDWQFPEEEFTGKVMAPFLGTEAKEAISNGDLKIVFEKGFFIEYFENKYPVSKNSYSFLLNQILNFNTKAREKDFYFLKEWEWKLKIQANPDEWHLAKNNLIEYLKENKNALDSILHGLKKINASAELLSEMLDQQYFRLVHWRTPEEKINYRRFFTINDLICLRMEDEQVFNSYHQFIGKLCNEGLIDGLRIDHIDGLNDPEGYLHRLRNLVGREKFIVVEKILELSEHLPHRWPIEGTSGYGFLSTVSQLFTDPEGAAPIKEAYSRISGEPLSYEEQVFKNKIFILKTRMGGELQNLVEWMKSCSLLAAHEATRILEWTEALAGFLAAWPVYRIYPQKFPLRQGEYEIITKAHKTACHMLPTLRPELDYLLNTFTGHADADEGDQYFFLQRCQQFTGPLAAKGIEDTTFYSYNPLISHNEVGDNPSVFGMGAGSFHRKMLHRQSHFPRSINATATHDTNRGEDARLRINVLSEIPEEWFSEMNRWHTLNAAARGNKNLPDRNEEYFIYQSLLGAWPYDINKDFINRTKAYLEKALREAKVHSSWAAPDVAYEKGVMEFLESILCSARFLNSFRIFAEKLAFCGAIYSLGQSLLKVTAPGIPDIYQGSELWDLSYVDPDNRRPVDYDLRTKFVNEMTTADPESLNSNLLENSADGHLKIFVLYKALQFRKSLPNLFEEGEYLPLRVSEAFSEKALCFARKSGNDYCVVVVPRLVVPLCREGKYPIGAQVWQDALLTLPPGAPEVWTNIYTSENLESGNGMLLLKQILGKFPVAILKPASNEI